MAMAGTADTVKATAKAIDAAVFFKVDTLLYRIWFGFAEA
jgi:hypothetical protein